MQIGSLGGHQTPFLLYSVCYAFLGLYQWSDTGSVGSFPTSFPSALQFFTCSHMTL